ncbi:MAG: hypothetical protein ACYST0_07230 [Planctomycetota bacterium]|jgi:hypothetical protein
MQTRILTAALSAIALVATLPAQGTYLQFGRGGPSCISSNADAHFKSTVSLRTTTLPNEYAYGYKAPKATTVVGFALYTRTASTISPPLKQTTGFYRAAGGPSGTSPVAAPPTTTGEMWVANTANWYITTFKVPQKVAKGENFWVSQYNSNTILASSLAGGSPSPLTIFYGRPAGSGTFTSTVIVRNPGVAILCKDETPVLTATGVPTPGNKTFALDISNGGAVGNLVWLVIGLSNKTAAGPISLPYDLGALGFPGSTLWTSFELQFLSVIRLGGTARFPIPVPANVPKGVKFYNQAYVINRGLNKIMFANAAAGSS